MKAEDKKRLLKEMNFYRRYGERTFEEYMERKIGSLLHLYPDRGLIVCHSLCSEMSSVRLGKCYYRVLCYDWSFEG